jgi:hypothetical protein
VTGARRQAIRFPDRVRLPFVFDVPALTGDLAALQAGDWVGHFVKQNYSGDWSAIPLRAPAGETHPIRMIYSDPSATEWVDTPWLDRSPALRRVIDTFHERLYPGGVLLLGHSESLLNVSTAFELLHLKDDLVYRKPTPTLAVAPSGFGRSPSEH